MTIYVQRTAGNTFEIRSDRHRLRAALQVFGKAIVTDCETDEKLEVHEVDGQLVVLDDGRAAIAATVASNTIERAART